jgi:transcriptional antiterminator RfaH
MMDTLVDQSQNLWWYVIQTKPKNENRARFHLTRAGIETLNPLMETYRSRNGGFKKTVEPLFPGYFFARFEAACHYPIVRWARGVKRILGNRDGPIPVREEIIHEIRRRVDDHGVARRPYDLKPEDPVRITAGPLKDLIGIFERWLPKERRIRILLRLLGYETSVELDYSQVEKVWHVCEPTTRC